METIEIAQISSEGRVREDYGDIASLVASIREFGIIQPIVVNKAVDGSPAALIVGGRRLAALKELGFTTLTHNVHFIWRDEVDPLRLRALEMEENLKRKDLTWQEQVKGKQALLETMQSLLGVSKGGGRTRLELNTGTEQGFGVRKLAAMLNESPATTSRDLQIARVIKKMPVLSKSPTRDAVIRRIGVLTTIISMSSAGASAGASGGKNWKLLEGDFRDKLNEVPDGSIDLLLTDPPYGTEIDSTLTKGTGLICFDDSLKNVLPLLRTFARESFRVMADNRYGVIFFGFNYYVELLAELCLAGFTVTPVPFIWHKRMHRNSSPSTRYGNAYEQAFIIYKGAPRFIRPGQGNVFECLPVLGTKRLHQAQKPVELLTKFILDMTSEGAKILDPFAGSGSTGEAALRSNRHVILVEKDEDMCNIIKTRLSKL